jgi:hypothetical protein
MWDLINKLGEMDVDRGYVLEALVDVIQEGGLSGKARERLEELIQENEDDEG